MMSKNRSSPPPVRNAGMRFTKGRLSAAATRNSRRCFGDLSVRVTCSRYPRHFSQLAGHLAIVEPVD